MKFNASDLNPELFLKRANKEAEEIFSKESTRRNRTKAEILETVLYGHAAEVYLIEYHNFKDDERKYKDVFDTEGNSIEVKVTEGEYYVKHVLDRAIEDKKQSWRKFSDILYIFIGNKTTADYHLHGIYKWNGEKFVLQMTESMV
ncbi:MAG TPA: hypothetical protein DHV22_10760 [Xanthomarina gelatinilytica]|uniref:Uncharacterized protein n=1 Tax=Xanthomarina gelatinilytica TaxID=1137281 RepID=A0A3D6BS04_9FLAO|nr:hypothetical protein [Xanthomarina gelatinilytica]